MVREALSVWQPVWVIVDGSDDGSREDLEALAQVEPGLTVLQHQQNRGKGNAVYTGIEQAATQGFTHVLTMDADAQHPAAAIKPFMQVSQQNPAALILGLPVFDENAPSLRVQGRKISNFWVNLETLWCGIGDSLFGFRIYPIVALRTVMDQTHFARRFDFEPEVVVRLAWQGMRIINIEVPVRYISAADGGVSQFRYLRDNTLLTWMHLRLLVGFFVRLPMLLRSPIKI